MFPGPRHGLPYNSPKVALQTMIRTRGNNAYGMGGNNQAPYNQLQMMQQQKSHMVRAQIRQRMGDMPPGMFQRQMPMNQPGK